MMQQRHSLPPSLFVLRLSVPSITPVFTPPSTPLSAFFSSESLTPSPSENVTTCSSASASTFPTALRRDQAFSRKSTSICPRAQGC